MTRPVNSLFLSGFTRAPGIRGRPLFVCGDATLERILVMLSAVGRPRVKKLASEGKCLCLVVLPSSVPNLWDPPVGSPWSACAHAVAARPTRRRRYIRLVDRLLGVRFTPAEIRQFNSHHRKDRGPVKKVIVHNRDATELRRHHVGIKYSSDGRIASFYCLHQQCRSECVRRNFATWHSRPCCAFR